MEKKNLLNIDDVCSLLNVKKSWVRSAIFRKKLPNTKIGKLVRFSSEDLSRWVEEQKRTTK